MSFHFVPGEIDRVSYDAQTRSVLFTTTTSLEVFEFDAGDDAKIVRAIRLTKPGDDIRAQARNGVLSQWENLTLDGRHIERL